MRKYMSYRPARLPFIDEVPAHWKIIPFRHLFSESAEVNGAEPVGPMLSVSGYRGVEVKEYDSDNRRRTAEEVETYRVVRRRQLAVNTMWMNYAGLGVSDVEGHMSPAYRAYNISKEINPRYAHHLLRSSIYVQGYTALLTGVRPNSLQMSRNDLMSFPILVPPLEEQQKIADYLDRETTEIDAFLYDQNLLIELLRERRLAQLAREVAGSDSARSKNEVPWAPGLKTPYPVVNIRRVAEMRTGHTPNRNKPEYWLDTNIPWFTLADVWQLRAGNKFLGETTEMISRIGLANSAADLLPAGTVVLSRTASVGFAGIMPRPMATSQDYWNWVCGPEILPDYLWFQFRAMRPEFDRIKSGSTHKTIYKADAAGMMLVLPPLEEQHAIVQRLSRVDEELAAAETDVMASIQLAQERRAALISAAVTGQIDLTDSDSSAAEQVRDELGIRV